MNDVEHRLRAVLLTCASADEAIWMLHQEHQVGQVLLSRAVATVFGLTLTAARQVVADAVHRQGLPPLEPQLSEEVGWPDREAGVLDTLEQTNPFWQHLASQDATLRACFLPSWDRPLLISVVLASTPLLRALATEPFSGPNPRGQVRVPRWPVPVQVDTELQAWSVQALIPDGVLPPLVQLAEALVLATTREHLGVGIDGTTILGSIQREGHVARFRTWSPEQQWEPEVHAFLSMLVDLTLTLCPQGQVHQAALDVARHLATRA